MDTKRNLDATGPFAGLPASAAHLPPLSEAEVVEAIRKHLEGLFPKVCGKCQRTFANLREYLQGTKYLGPPMSYDAELGRWNPREPLGSASFANCSCGNTLALTSEGMPLLQLWRLLNWTRTEMQRRGLSQAELLNYLRLKVRKQVLAEPGQGTGRHKPAPGSREWRESAQPKPGRRHRRGQA
jgi:hypothetical protein